jgi:hypothetical protein
MLKNKFFIAILLILGICVGLSAQTPPSPVTLDFKRNGSWVNHQDYGVCPNGNGIEYRINGWNANCHTLSVTNGTAGAVTNGIVSIIWEDDGDSCKINVKKSEASPCSTAAPGATFFIPVLSLAKVKPTITQTPPGSLDVGFVHNVSYTASAQYPWLGAVG